MQKQGRRHQETILQDFLGGPVAKSSFASAGDRSLIPALGRFHMSTGRGGQLSLCATTAESMLCSLRATTTELMCYNY